MKTGRLRRTIAAILVGGGIILVGISFACGLTSGNPFNFDKESFTKTFSQTVSDIDLNYAGCQIYVKKGDALKVVADNIRKDSLGFETRGETLRIYNKDKVVYGISNGSEMKLTLYVPDNIELDTFTADCGAGVLDVLDIKAKNIILKNGAGLSKFNRITADKINIRGGAGKIDAKNISTDDLSIKGGVGEINVSGDIDGNCSISSGIGSISLTTSANQYDFKFDISKGIGDLRINGHTYSSYKEENSAKYTMKIDNGIGEIKVFFE